METAAVLSTPAFHSFDKGLRARSLGDQLSAVVAATTLLKENPFPSLVNQVAVRLADVFKDSNNQVKRCIARVLADSSEHLSLIFSSEEVLKRIYAVTYSNDPISRALTLEVLGSLAQLYCNTKKVHHLILESLTAENDFEFECAAQAMICFAKISSDFAAATVERLVVLLTSTELPVKRKILLIPAIGTMKSDINATKECFALERFLLDTSDNFDLVETLLIAMTSLAQSTRYAVPQQLEILLKAAIESDSKFSVRLTALTQLYILARYSHVWDAGHLQSLHELKLKVEKGSHILMNRFLKILVRLSRHVRPNHSDFFQEILFELSYLFTTEKTDQLILVIQFACNIYIYQPGDLLAKNLVDAFALTMQCQMHEKQVKKFFRILAQFLGSQSVNDSYVSSLLTPLLETTSSHPHSRHVVEVFCCLVNKLPFTIDRIHNWAKSQIGTLANPAMYTAKSIEPLVFLLIPPTAAIENDAMYLAAGSDYDKYIVARTALRNGHWRNVAFPNLQAIDTSGLSIIQKLWIEILSKVAYSQLMVVTPIALLEQKQTLVEAHGKATELFEFSPQAAFVFLRNLINAMLQMSHTFHAFFSGVALMQCSAQPLKGLDNIPRIRFALVNCAKELVKCDATWTDLYRNAFTADPGTLDYLAFMHTSISLLLNGAKRLLNDDNIREILLPSVLHETAISQKGRNILNWAKGTLEQLGALSETNLKNWGFVVESLLSFPQSIPKYIFHQEYLFEIKLNVSSAVNGEITVQANTMTPLQIDGFIYTNHPSKVESVIVKAELLYSTTFANNSSYKSSVKLNGDTHFSAQFIMSFRQSCTVDFSIDFVDSQKRTWSYTGRSKLKVNINE